MGKPNYPFVILLMNNVFTAICQERGSLTFVIDSTRSMRFDIQQVKESADGITQTVFTEKASQIKNMVLVTFNDPDAKLEVETEKREELKQYINNITAKNPRENWDCEEPSMKGVLLGLESSLVGSYMYVFTDASAKDFWRSKEIISLCQKKQTQITFVLTGHCKGQLDIGFQVYYEIASACSGLAFYLAKNDVNEVLTTIKETIRGNKTVITAVQVPPYKYTNIPFEIDEETEYAIITASGSGVSLSVTGPKAEQKIIMWLRNAKVIKLIKPTSGNYTAKVRGSTETAVYVVGKTDFLFSHGFSVLESKTLKDTTPQPLANTKTHLLISVSDPKHAVNITSVQILDTKERVISILPLTLVAEDLYTTRLFIVPSKRFKIAVIGTSLKNGKVIRRLAKIPVTVQDPPTPKSKKPLVTISEGPTIKVEYGKAVKLTCKISAYPEPKIIWKGNLRSNLTFESSVVELPYEYISYLTITNVTKGERYSCHASNTKGSESKEIVVIVKEAFDVKTAIKGTTEVQYGKTATLVCDIRASVPMHISWTFKEEKTGTSKELVSTNKNVIISDHGKQLTINKVDENMVGKYSCKAYLLEDLSSFVIHTIDVKLSGLTLPKVTGVSDKVTSKGSNVVIECRVSGVPPPTITWQFMAKDNWKFVSIPGSDNVLHISNVDEKHAGSYKCIANNFVGFAEYVTTLTVQVQPKVIGVATKTTTEGLNLVIECFVSGIPQPTITWQFMAKADSKFVSVAGSDNVLRIASVNEKNAGRYKCIAQNVLGTAEHVTTLTVHVLPKITGDVVKIASTGSNVIIECNVSGIPQPTIAWQFMANDSAKFLSIPGSDNVWRISSVDKQHAGLYKCIAHNVVGDAEHITTLAVQALPKVDGVAVKTASKGSNVNIECHVSGLPPPTITWQFMANDASKFVLIPGSGNVLRLSNVDENHAGRYKCIAHNVVGDAEHITTLTVQVAPKVTGIASITTSKDSKVIIECSFSGIPQPTVTWLFMVNDGSKFVSIPGTDSALVISNVDEKHAGLYKCIARNNEGTAEHVTTLIVHVPPMIIGIPAKTASKGSNVIIECIISGIPEPTVSWQFMDKDGSKFVAVPGSDSVYRIFNVDENNAGRYKCVANNIVGYAEFNTTLIVQVPPKVTGIAAKITSKGSSVTIECNVSGIPQPTIAWLFMSNAGSEFVSIPGSDSVLHISNVDEIHAGLYKCVARNDEGTAEHTTALAVHVFPKITGIAAKTSSKGSNVIIECAISGIPQPTVSWQFMARDNFNFVSIPGSDSVLHISNVGEQHAGRYKCIAHNVVGDAEHVTTLSVQDLPVVTGVAAKTTFKNSDVVIECNVSGIPQPTITWQFAAKDTTNFVSIPGSDNMLRISNVDETHAGRYKCIARNVLGEAEHITTLIVQVLPKVTGIAAKAASRGSNVTIEYSISGIPEPTVTWQFMAKDTLNFESIPGSHSVLRISNVDGQHVGRYKCIAHNVAGDAEHITTLSIQDLPEVTGVAAKTTSKNSDVVIECNISGIPQPTITWQFAAKDATNFVSITGSDKMLRISNVDETHAGRYKCIARNVLGEAEHITTLTVQVLPKVTGIVAKAASRGSNVTIECTISGIPEPRVAWQFLARDTLNFVSIPGSHSVLHISNVDEKHVGRYKCIAHNVVGDAEHVTILSIQDVPEVTGVATKTASKNSDVVIECNVSGIPEPMITWQFAAKGTTKFVSILGSDNILRLSNVDETHTGRYKCIARNVLGEAEHVTTLTVQVLPKVTGPAAKTASRGSNITIECIISGIPEPTVTWQFMARDSLNFVSIPGSDSVLHISNVDGQQVGRYKCIAHNVVGDAEHVTTLLIQDLPEVTGVANKTASKNSDVVIECSVSGIPQPAITWEFAAQNTAKFVSIPGSDNMLRLSNVDETHTGSYKCIARNILGKAEHVTTLTIQDLPKVTGVDAIMTSKYSDVVIECNVSGIPRPTITWQFAAIDTSTFVSIPGSDSVLSISNVNETDAGLYKCIAHNNVGEAEHVTTLTVKVSPKVTGLADQTTSKGSNVIIQCSLYGTPKPSITWQFMAINGSRFVTIPGSDSVLHISNISEKHAGRYKCIAHNYLGESEHITTLTVQVLPKITGVPNKIATKSSNVEIECEVSGIPPPTITWQFMAKNGSKFERLFTVPGHDDVLSLSNIDEQHAGLYKCVAQNVLGSAEHVTTLTVHVLPEITGAATTIASKGSNIIIECNVYGIPQPKIYWKFMANDASKFVPIPGSDSVLRVSNVEEKHAGRYKCIAYNIVGEVEHVATLIVQVRPKVTGATAKTVEKNSNVVIECNVSGTPQPTVTWQFAANDDSKFMSIPGSDSVLRISNIEEKHAGLYKCIAHNIAGEADHVTTLYVQAAPKVTGVATKAAPKGSDVIIECNVTGVPTPSIIWLFAAKDEMPIHIPATSGSVLRIRNVEGKHAGRYTCMALNVLGSAVHNTALIVQVPPKVTGDTTKIASKGSNISIECNVTGIPQPTVTWQFMAKGISKFVAIPGFNSVLSILNINENDAGSYKCVAHNIAGEAEHVTTLTVQVLPEFTTSSAKKTSKKGSNVTIDCPVSGIPKPTITWQFKAKESSKFVSVSGSDDVLHISNVGEKDAGLYKCIAHNVVGDTEHVTTLNVQVPPQILYIASMIYESVEGKDDILRIPCTTSGWPKPVITWKLNGAVISESEKYQFEDGDLIIKDPQVSDSKTYTCEATNDVGHVNASFQAEVHRLPKVEGNMTQKAKQGLPVTITCKVSDGIPRPTVTWEFMAQGSSEFVSIPETDNELRIWGTEEKHAGHYKCVAHNAAGDVEYVTTLIVQAPPKITSTPAIIYKSVEDRDAALKIPCVVTGVPKPTITWKMDDTIISQSEKYAIEDGTLIIKNPKVNDSNTYKCEATNEVGSDNATFQADVLQAPKITGVNETKANSGESVKIECVVLKGVPTPTVTWQFRGKSDSDFIDMPGTNNIMYISDVEKLYAGHYKCIAQNDVGIAEHTTNLIVQYAPRIISRMKKYKALEGDIALRIPCRADGDPKPTITWKIPGAERIPNERYTIIDNALVIMHPRQDDSKLSATCEAKNSLGVVTATFGVQVDEGLTDFGTINAVNILHGTSKKLECGSSNANQSVRWFKDGEELKSKENIMILENVNESSEGNYTCHVSDMKGAHTMTFAVQIGFAPFFLEEQNSPVFDWDGSDNENDNLNCYAESNPPADIVWTYNGKELGRHGNDSYQLAVSGNWGNYSCKVSNVHGTIQRSFKVISSKCLIKRKANNYQTMPLILSQDLSWPVLDSRDDYLKVPSGDSVIFSCPKAPKNSFKLFPTMTQITAKCDKQDTFIVNGKEQKLSDLHCAEEIDQVVVENPEKCLSEGSKLMRVGYEVNDFLEAYEVCFDKSKNMPLYSRVTMYKSNQGRSVTQNWYNYPGIGAGKSDGGYTCANETSTCCYSKTQLVNARDVSDPAQKSTFIDTLNAVPYWRPCEGDDLDPWQSIENKVRYWLSLNSQFVAWSGTHELQEKNGHIIPRYLWKMVRFNEEESIAVVYVNGPSPTEEDTLCANICADGEISWFGEPDKNTYCCEIDEFLKAFDLYDSPVGNETPHLDVRTAFEE